MVNWQKLRPAGRGPLTFFPDVLACPTYRRNIPTVWCTCQCPNFNVERCLRNYRLRRPGPGPAWPAPDGALEHEVQEPRLKFKMRSVVRRAGKCDASGYTWRPGSRLRPVTGWQVMHLPVLRLAWLASAAFDLLGFAKRVKGRRLGGSNSVTLAVEPTQIRPVILLWPSLAALANLNVTRFKLLLYQIIFISFYYTH